MLLDKINTEILNIYNPVTTAFAVKPDGKFYRFDHAKNGDKAIWVIGAEWIYKGNTYWSMNFGSWREGTSYNIKSWEDKDVDNNFRKDSVKKQQEIMIRVEYENKKRHLDCAEKWGPRFNKCAEKSAVHPYMKSKGFSDNGIARIDQYGNLLIPAYKDAGLVGLQRIYEKDGKFEKRYSSGLDKKGSFCPLVKFENPDVIYIAEGYSTAKSIHEAVRKPTVCVWDCGNIMPAVAMIKAMYPKAKLVICADDDIHKDPKLHKIGERKARETAKRHSNCIVKLPNFGEFKNPSWTDFNDLHNFFSLEQVKKQVLTDSSAFKEIILKGYSKEGNFYYYNTETMNISSLSPMEHTRNNLLAMAEGKYWGDRYRYKKNAEGENTLNPDFDYIVENIFREQRKVGFFDYANIRGYGVHADNNNIIVNLGDSIYLRGEIKPIHGSDIKTKFFYEANRPIDIDFNDCLTDQEGEEIISAFKHISYKNKIDYIPLCGFIAMAQVFGALKWRSQLWLTGEKGSGKTTILEYIKPLLPFSIAVRDSTASGIRQEVTNDSMAIMYDESEPNSEKARKIMTEIMEFARQSSNMSDSMQLRGTASGKAIKFRPNVIFMFSSIQKFLPTVADISRFYPIELRGSASHDKLHYEELEKKMMNISSFGNKLFVRMVRNFEAFKKNVELCKDILKENGYESRQADQLSPLVAGYHFIGNTAELRRDEAEYTIQRINFKESDYVRDNADNESEKCLDTILDSIIPGKGITILQTIEDFRSKPGLNFADKDLETVGLKFFIKSEELFISANHHQLIKLLERTMYSDYAALLRRHDDFMERRKTCRIAKKVRRGVCIKLRTD